MKDNKIAFVKGKDLNISTKHSLAICRFIKGKNPTEAIFLLESIIKKRIALPMRGEIPHRHNMPKGMPQGRYPIKASKCFIKLLKNLNANASVNGLSADSLKIVLAKADRGSRYYRPTRIGYGRKRKKQTHVLIEAVEAEDKNKEIKKKEKGKNKQVKEKAETEKIKIEEKKDIKKTNIEEEKVEADNDGVKNEK